PLPRGTDDELGEAGGAVADTGAGGGAAHLGQPLPVGEEGAQRPGDVVGGEVGVRDDGPAPRRDHPGGVAPLLTVADGQGHVDGRQPQGGQLADRPGPGAAEHEVGGGVGAGHVVEVGTHVVVPQPGGRAAHRLVLAVAGEVEHLDPGLVQGRGAGGDGVVDALRAEGAAGDEQRGALRVEPEGGGTGTAAGRGVGGALGDEV